jgi:hypothetical protein
MYDDKTGLFFYRIGLIIYQHLMVATFFLYFITISGILLNVWAVKDNEMERFYLAQC